MTSYDSIPYPNNSYPLSAPANLKAIAQAFGHKSNDLERARVLEIGCASGGNIIPLATRFPNATFLGIDLSVKQIATARDAATCLKLDHITFEDISILDFDLKGSKFDYIIAHGVYSWVPADVRDHVLKICGECLEENGVAYINYNTLPGWSTIKTLRDMMLYHSEDCSQPSDIADASRKMLDYVSGNMEAKEEFYKQAVDSEIKALEGASDNYLLHDHLEDVNEPCYFHEFAAKAENHGLKYLADTDLTTMFLRQQNEQSFADFTGTKDIIRQEQYADFTNNRRFRTSLLVKESANINRNISANALVGLKLIPAYRLSESLDDGQKGQVDRLDVVNIQNPEISIPLMGREICTCYVEMLEKLPNRMNLDEIVSSAAKILGEDKKETIRFIFSRFVSTFLFSGLFALSADEQKIVTDISDKPKVADLARLQASASNLVTNALHENVKLSGDQQLVIQYFNGENSKAQISTLIQSHIEKGELKLSIPDETGENSPSYQEQVLSEYIDTLLTFYSNNALLTA